MSAHPKKDSDAKKQEDLKAIIATYDADKDGKLSDAEIAKIKLDYEKGKAHPLVGQYFDKNKDGKLDDEEFAELHKDLQDTNVRYAPYLAALARAVRYAAYTSDVGEAFRPIVHPKVVTAAYGLSWLYVTGDVAYHGYDCYYSHRFGGSDLFSEVSKRAVFQSVASMALPAFTIHSAVKYSKKYLFKPYAPNYLKWGPTTCGLLVVPFLPVMWDHPVEYVCDELWARVLPLSDSAKKALATQPHHH